MSMNSEFLFKLGQSKAEKLQEEFTMIHNESAFEIISKIGPDGFALYFALSTYAFGKTNIMTFPKNKTLAKQMNVSERTIQRWKAKCELGGAIRTVYCYLPSGTQTSSVILFNVSYSEIPEGWDTIARNGFVLLNGTPIPREEVESLARIGMTKMSPYSEIPRQKCHPISEYPDRAVMDRVTDLSSSLGVEIACAARDNGQFFEGEEDQVKEDLSTVVVELVQQFENLTKEPITKSKVKALITRYGVSKVWEGLTTSSWLSQSGKWALRELYAHVYVMDGQYPKRLRI